MNIAALHFESGNVHAGNVSHTDSPWLFAYNFLTMKFQCFKDTLNKDCNIATRNVVGNVSQTEPTLTMVARFRHLTMKVQCFKDTLN